LICCWQPTTSTASVQTSNPNLRRAMPRKFPTPESAGWSQRLNAIVETTRDGPNGQLGCLGPSAPEGGSGARGGPFAGPGRTGQDPRSRASYGGCVHARNAKAQKLLGWRSRLWTFVSGEGNSRRRRFQTPLRFRERFLKTVSLMTWGRRIGDSGQLQWRANQKTRRPQRNGRR
jgi:hypothetical protein